MQLCATRCTSEIQIDSDVFLHRSVLLGGEFNYTTLKSRKIGGFPV